MINIDKVVDKYLKESGWHGFPEGWDHDSVVKFAESLVKDGITKEGFFTACVSKMKDHLDDPEGFCAATIDEVKGTTFWRTGPKGHKGEK